MATAPAYILGNPRAEIGKKDIERRADFMSSQFERMAHEAAEVGKSVASDLNPDDDEATPYAPNQRKDVENVLPLAAMFRTKQVGRRSMNTLQKWEGFVESIGPDYFVASVYDVFDRSRSRETATIPFAVLEKDEQSYLKIGAPFQLIAGFSKNAKGTREKETIIYFRRYISAAANSISKKNDGKVLASLLRRA
jgi:hypothetical protein